MRLHDAHLGAVVDVVPARPGRLTIRACGPCSDGDTQGAKVRALLLVDLVRRTAELGGLQVVVVHDVVVQDDVDAVPSRHDRLDADLRALNVHPAGRPIRPGESIDVVIGPITATDPRVARIHAQTVLLEGTAPADGLVSRVAERGLDALSLRLALLEHHYRRPADLTWMALVVADSTLARWRAGVATWAMQPSVAMPHSEVAAIVTALEDDLDTPRAVGLLRDLETSPGIPDGGRFEAFAYLDRALGLDLARDVGRAAPASSGAASRGTATDSGW